MKQKTSYRQISKGLTRLLKKPNPNHFRQKDLSFDTNSRKRYLMLFEISQKILQGIDKPFKKKGLI